MAYHICCSSVFGVLFSRPIYLSFPEYDKVICLAHVYLYTCTTDDGTIVNLYIPKPMS